MLRFFFNLGRSLYKVDAPCIFTDVRERYNVLKNSPEKCEIYVLALEDDKLLEDTSLLPPGSKIVKVKADGRLVDDVKTDPGSVFVLNGGPTATQSAMLVHLSRGCTLGEVVNVQRDGTTQMIASREGSSHSEMFYALAEDLLDAVNHNGDQGDWGYVRIVLKNFCPAFGVDIEEILAELAAERS